MGVLCKKLMQRNGMDGQMLRGFTGRRKAGSTLRFGEVP